MSQACSVKVVFATEKHLRFVLEASESRGVNNPVPINLKRGAVVPRIAGKTAFDPFIIEFVVELVGHTVCTLYTQVTEWQVLGKVEWEVQITATRPD